MVNIIGMNLRTYLSGQKIPATQFAATIGVSVAALHRYIAGDRVPRTDVLERISCVTDGAVQPNDFFDFASGENHLQPATEAV